MKARFIIALLLVFAISLLATVPPASARVNLDIIAEDETRLSTEEEQQARDLVRRFSERFQATNDIGPLVDELFVNDFSQRLQKAPLDVLPWASLDKLLLSRASGDELRRYYIAYMNFDELLDGLTVAAKRLNEQSADQGGDSEAYAELTPEIVQVLRSDPVLVQMSPKDEEENQNEGTKEDKNDQPTKSVDPSPVAGATPKADDDATEQSEVGFIKHPWQLHSISATYEKASAMMRQRLAYLLSLSPPPANDINSELGSEKFDLDSLDDEAYGYPQGTRIVEVNILYSYQWQLIKINGQFKILSVHPYLY